MNIKPLKIIFINSRSYGREFPNESDKFFYLFGVGHFLAWEVLKLSNNVLVENWRADKTIKHDLEKTIDGITCRIFKGRETKFAGTVSFSMIKTLRRLEKQKDFCILVHFQGMHNIGYDIITWLVPKIPVLSTHHGGGNFHFKYNKTKRIRSLLAEKFDKLTLKKRFDHLFVQTETEKKYLEDFLPETKISRVTPFGFDFDLFKPLDKTEARKKLGLSLNGKILLSIGRADPLKGVQHVVKIYQQLKSEIPGIELLCIDVQPGDLYFNLIRESEARFIGHVSYYDLPMYYSAADVLVYLPFDDESLNFAGPGYVNAEALACGIPVVSSLLVHYWDDCIYEVARVPDNIDDAVKMTHELLDNPPDPERCREISFKYFNWSYVMEHHLKVYNSLLRKYYNTTISGSIAAE